MPEPLNLPQPEAFMASSAELELIPGRIEEIETAADFADEVMGEGEVAPTVTGLEAVPVPLAATGEPVDMAKYRRVSNARQAVAEALVDTPQSPRIEELAA